MSTRLYFKRRRERAQKLVRALKRQPCTDCGQSFPYYVMHFDHVGRKTDFVSSGVQNRWAEEKLLREIAECELVCANCHAIRTFARKQHLTYGRVIK